MPGQECNDPADDPHNIQRRTRRLQHYVIHTTVDRKIATRMAERPTPTGPLGAEWVWPDHVQQDYGKNPNGTGNDMVRDKVGHVPWNT
jgi:hypothetical protein